MFILVLPVALTSSHSTGIEGCLGFADWTYSLSPVHDSWFFQWWDVFAVWGKCTLPNI